MSLLKYNYIVIEGNIGAGKTSLASMISRDFNTRLILEQFADNPFLPEFYENRERYALPLELSFLTDRYQQLKGELVNHELLQQQTVSDYFLNKSLIFASVTLKNDELDLYRQLFHIINLNLPKPDLLVYLQRDISTLKANIQKRGRDYEKNIDEAYLEQLEHGYLNFFKNQTSLKVLVIDTGSIDFVNDERHYQSIINLVNAAYQPGVHRAIIGI